MTTLEELESAKKDETYFAFRVPTDLHRSMRAILAQRGISGQTFFLRVVEDLVAGIQETTKNGVHRL